MMIRLPGSTYDVYAENAEGWLIDSRTKLSTEEHAKAIATKYVKEYDPDNVYIVEHKTYCFYSYSAKNREAQNG